MSDLHARRMKARAEWLATVEMTADRLPKSILDYCRDPRNLETWWPGTSEQKQEAA